MEKRRLGQSNLEVSLIGLGTNNFGRRMSLEDSRPVIHRALDLGITHFDTADVYGNGGSETVIGEVLGERRKDIVLATKFGIRMAGSTVERRGAREYVLSAVEASLKRLQTDWIDLLWYHRPDPETPIEETLGAMEELRTAGKVRHLALSNFAADELDAAMVVAEGMNIIAPVACQVEYSLLERGAEEALLPAIAGNNMSLIPYYPLAGGALTGKYRKGAQLPERSRWSSGSDRFLTPNWDKIEQLAAFAEARGRSLLELAMSWLAGRPTVASIIAGATRPDQLDANVASASWQLSASECEELDRIVA